MGMLNEKVENYILENNSNDNPKTVGEIFSHFENQGFSTEEIALALNAFNKKYVNADFAEYDT